MSVNYDFWTAEQDVLSQIFGGYNYGYSNAEYEQELEKCCITEITDDEDFEDDMEEQDINVDELSKAFDYVIEDWKIKMEVIIGEGLRKLRKSHKERKLMMKYLPGDKKVQMAKQSIAKDWKIDFQKAFGTTHKKLEKLAADKAKEVENVVKTDVKEPQINKNKKKVVNINMKANPESAYGNLRNLITQLDKMINNVQGESPTLHSIPIYSKEARGQVLPAYSNHWLEFQKSLLQKIDFNCERRQSFMDVLEDFKVKHSPMKMIKKSTKSRVDGTNAVKSQKRMLERRLNKKEKSGINAGSEFTFKQYNKAGKEHFLIVKKKNETSDNMEDIFCDWKSNLTDTFEQRRQAALAARKQRTRKLSNRALRKELLKEIDQEEKQKPKSYSDVLKTNLKAPMEDIFEAWRDYLQELDEIVRSESRTSFTNSESVEDILDSAQSYQKTLDSSQSYQTELHKCGQPTIKTAKKATGLDKEIIFASWRHNLSPQDENTVVLNQKYKYQPENYFASWKYNLDTTEDYCQNEHDYEPEMTFYDWIQMFEESKLMRSESGKMLKNKERKERRSKKNNKKH